MGVLAQASTSSFSDRVLRLLERVDYRQANSEKEREAVFRLRYDAYVREGVIPASFSKKFSDNYDDAENAWTFGVYVDGSLASSIRVHVATQQYPDIPAAHVFSDILKPLIDSGKTLVDPIRFVTDSASARQYPELPYVTVRLGIVASEHFGADFTLATVRAEHQAFYKRVFGGRVVSPPRPYPSLNKPISLMSLHYPTAKEQIFRRYPFFHSTAFERRMLFERIAKTARRTAA